MKKKTKIEFVSYDGEYPNLCRGEFIVKIDGELYCFHYRYGEKDFEKNCYPSFWTSGGNVSFDNEWNAEVTNGPWQLDMFGCEIVPKRIKELLPDLLEVFNENVPEGCCGGCV